MLGRESDVELELPNAQIRDVGERGGNTNGFVRIDASHGDGWVVGN